MTTANVKEIRNSLLTKSSSELIQLCLRLARFKKENKELLTYLLFEVGDEANYVNKLKWEIDNQFDQINKKSYYYIRKSLRKILTYVKRHCRYSQKKETEIELLLFFCKKLREMSPSVRSRPRIRNMYKTQINLIEKRLPLLHEDLQYDFGLELEKLGESRSKY